MRRYDGAACGYLLLALRDPAGFCPLGRGRCPQESAPEGNAGGLPVSRPQGHAPDSPHWQLGFWRPCWRDAFKASERQQAPTVRQVHPAPTPLSPPLPEVPEGTNGADSKSVVVHAQPWVPRPTPLRLPLLLRWPSSAPLMQRGSPAASRRRRCIHTTIYSLWLPLGLDFS